ncbi:MmcQ/YjbR family DNA-binding protein [Acidicapsa acidisoli]|uniref:MmcQ/YjbR family DNA-binding protein n=1 Tax=Acidicapsa acidisoli TaxID=1615681 RepID=UPI0021DFE75C|nr:MmcQ/YjbR family DNA-binding protein [Acidicapsa acidisoli]
MTADEFRELALNLKDATESAHMKHPDFRAHGRIFATLGYPDSSFGMVKLSPQDQRHFVDLHPQAFVPVRGAWGLQGCTSVRLGAVKPDALAQALDLAWQRSAEAPPVKKAKKKVAQRTA